MRNEEVLMRALNAWAITACFLFGCGMASNTEVHLLPAGFQGDVFIVPGIAAGVSPQRENGAAVFNIPADGILVTQDHLSTEWNFSQFYYVRPSGERQRLEYEPSSIPDTSSNRANKAPVVWFKRTGTISGIDLPCSVNFVQYYVGSRAHLLSRIPDSDELRFRVFLKKRHLCE